MLTIRSTVADTPSLPFAQIARDVLGDAYDLSLVICGDFLAQRMNAKYRKKTYRPNVLSFPLSKTEGEIFLNIRAAARESHRFAIPYRDRLAHLFAHGCLHLSGLDHGTVMDAYEARILKKHGFAIHA